MAPIGYKFEKTSIGCCAEVNASNPIFKMHYLTDLKKVSLSKAIRPKTMVEKAKCKICTEIFLEDGI